MYLHVSICVKAIVAAVAGCK